MTDPKQLNLQGDEVGSPYKVSITETIKAELNSDDADAVKTTERKVSEYRVRAGDWKDAVDAAMSRHLDLDDEAMEYAVRVKAA